MNDRVRAVRLRALAASWRVSILCSRGAATALSVVVGVARATGAAVSSSAMEASRGALACSPGAAEVRA